MDAIRTIVNDASAYLAGNSIYTSYKQQWQYLLESYVGGDEYREAGHLIKYQLESDEEYRNRLATTPLQNHCGSVISVYNSFLFKSKPKRVFGSIETSPKLNNFLYDADLDGRSFDAFMKDVATWASVFGSCWVIVSKPATGAASLAEEIAQDVRPYLSILTPLAVLDWSWTRLPNGRYELDYLKYVEETTGDLVTIKEWTPEAIKTTVVDSKENVINDQTVEINGLGKIPAVIAYNKRALVRGIGISDIADIADAQKFIYNCYSEIEQSIRLDSHPSLVTTPDTNVGTGAGSLIHVAEGTDPGLKPYLLEFSGASVDKILATIEKTVESIDKMANTGAIRATESRTVSGVALETEFSLLNARLAEKATAMELVEEQIWRLYAEYENLTWDGIIEYPSHFNVRDAKNDLEFYKSAAEASVPSATYKKTVYKNIARLASEDEDTIAQMEAEIDSADVEQPQPEAAPQPQQTVTYVEDNSNDNMDDNNEPFEVHIMLNPATGEMVIVKSQEQHDQLTTEGWLKKTKKTIKEMADLFKEINL